MSSEKEKVVMVALGLFAHCCLVFVPIIGEFRPTVGSVAFAFATLVIASHYDLGLFAPCWKTEHPNISILIEICPKYRVKKKRRTSRSESDSSSQFINLAKLSVADTTFLARLGILNFAITTIWLPIVMFLDANRDVIAILVWPLDMLLLCGAAAKWAQDPEAPRQMAALFALVAAACAIYVVDFNSSVCSFVTGCCTKPERRVRIVDNLQQNELRSVLKPIRGIRKTY